MRSSFFTALAVASQVKKPSRKTRPTIGTLSALVTMAAKFWVGHRQAHQAPATALSSAQATSGLHEEPAEDEQHDQQHRRADAVDHRPRLAAQYDVLNSVNQIGRGGTQRAAAHGQRAMITKTSRHDQSRPARCGRFVLALPQIEGGHPFIAASTGNIRPGSRHDRVDIGIAVHRIRPCMQCPLARQCRGRILRMHEHRERRRPQSCSSLRTLDSVYSGPLMPPSLRTRQKWIASNSATASGMAMQCNT